MAEGQVNWRSEAFRRKVIEQIDEAVRLSNTPVAKSSVEMENHVFNKAKTREEYLALVARLILHVKDFNNQKREKAQAMHAQMAGASGLGQIGGMQDPMSALQNSADNQKREKAQAMHAQMAGASGMGQIGGMQDPMNALQNMAMSGSGMPPGQPPDIISTETDRHVLAHLETLNRSLHTSRPQENPIINQQPDIANDISLLQQSYSTEETSSSKNTCKEKTSNGITAGRKAGDGKTHADGLVIKREPFTDDVDDEGPANKRVRFTLDNGPSTSAQDNSPLTEMSPVTSDTINLLSHGIESRETADNSVLPCICDATNKRKITQDAVNQMQYEVLVEQKKKLIAQTKYYNLMNEDVLKKREKLNAELAYYKDMHEKLRKDLHPGFSDTSMMAGPQPMGPMQPMPHGPQMGPRQQLLQQQRPGMPQRPHLQRQDAFIVTSAQPVQQPGTSQQTSTPASGFMQSSTAAQLSKQSQFVSSLLGQASPQVSQTAQGIGTVPSPAQAGIQSVGSPLSMMTSPHSNIDPSSVSRGGLSVGDPSPSAALNTPGNPGSVPSPASQTADEQAYLEKLKQLSKYIDPLKRMIKKTEKQDDRSKDADHRNRDISKMKNLLDILSNPAKRVPMSTLIKCEQVLEKIQFGTKIVSSTPHTTSAAPTAPTQPTMLAASHVHMCQPLLDSVAAHITSPMFNHTLQRTFGPAVAALYGSPIRAPSPPLKKPRVEEPVGKIPDLLQGEIARLDRRFKVKLDPMRHAGQKDLHLVCKLDDKYLPRVPPILVTIPADYPDDSPECSTSGREYEATPFLRSAQKALVTHLLELPSKFSLTALLDMWEMSVRKACISPS